ncbi:hypothetical protein E4U21_006071 [Claviceps maximensis]|nr:hypothetical protein E4U21_006071 [Claviceps maximensis]
MRWAVGDAAASRLCKYQQESRQRRAPWTRRAVSLGGLVFAGVCISLFYLIALPPVTLNKTTHRPLNLTPPVSTSPATSANTGGSDDGVILLHPEQHVYRKANTLRFNWTITAETRSPDGVTKLIYLINGRFPGPVIEARSGDLVEVNVHNGVEQLGHPGVSIHWHGLNMKGANEMDGVVGLTQCAIQSKKEFTYRFRIPDDQAGITPTPASNEQMGCMEESLSTSQPSGLKKQTQISIITKANSFYLLEIGIIEVAMKFLIGLWIPTTTGWNITAGFSMEASDGSIRPIAVDGGNWLHENTPRARAIGLLHPGERVDVILDRIVSHTRELASARTSRMTIELDRENMPLVNFALQRIQSFSIEWRGGETSEGSAYGGLEQPVMDVFNLADALGHTQLTDTRLSRGPFQRAVLYSTVKIRAAKHNQPVGSINHTSWINPTVNALPLLSLTRENWANAIPQPAKVHNFDVPWFKVSGPDTWIELTLNNFDDRGHPFHLHGYEFYVVAREQASGTYRGYNPFDHSSTSQAHILNVKNPLRKDTVHIPPMGYVVLRFPLDNDGLWLLHCHVLWHEAVGMGIAIQVGDISEDVRQRSRSSCLAR